MKNRRMLASGPVTGIEICPCGSCYLTIGPITMAVQLGVLSELGDVVARAMRSLRAENVLDQVGALEESDEAGNETGTAEVERAPAAPEGEPPFAN